MKIDHRKDREDWNLLDSPATAGAVLILLMIISMFLVGCSAPIKGEVVGKDVDPGRTETYWTSERRGCGTETYTTTTTVAGGGTKTVTKTRQRYCDNRVQRTRNVPPSWDLFIRDAEGERHQVEVSRSVYERIRIGEMVDTSTLR